MSELKKIFSQKSLMKDFQMTANYI